MKRRSVIIAFLAVVLCGPAALAQQSAPSGQAQNWPNWVGTWAASQQIPEPRNALAPADLTDATLRQIVHVSLGGKTLRVHISNAFGTAPLEFTSVHIALPVADDLPKIEPATDRALSPPPPPSVIVPAGAEYISDPIHFAVEPDSSLAISFHLAQPPAQETSHPGSRATSYLVHGDHVADADLPGATKFDHWFDLAGVDVEAPAGARSIVALGDSITDGHGATTNGNDRWPDDLARRLLAAHAVHPPGERVAHDEQVDDEHGAHDHERDERRVLEREGGERTRPRDERRAEREQARGDEQHEEPAHPTAPVHLAESGQERREQRRETRGAGRRGEAYRLRPRWACGRPRIRHGPPSV